MTVLLHASDPHFGTEQPRAMDALLALAAAERPEVLVLSGDITQRATARQFAAARAFVARVKAGATLVLPGNHDIPLFDLLCRVRAPYDRYRTAFGDDLEPSFESPAWLVVGVNTTRPWRHKHGEVSPAQIARVAGRLGRASPAQLRVVVTHQPVHVTRRSDERNLLRGCGAAVRAWSAAGADAILGGHIHLPYAQSLAEHLPALAHPTWCIQAGTALSSRIRDGIPNSVNLLRYAPGEPAFLVERWDLDAGGAFRMVSRLRAARE